MGDEENWRRFEQLAMPHLDAAYNLALWITRNTDDAQDVVQDALMRAMRYIGSLRLESARPWLLQIVRHTCYTWLKENRPQEKVLLDDPEDAWRDLADASSTEPPAIAIRKAEREQINAAIAALPVGYREVFVLRELEGKSYAEIADITGCNLGTVKSRLNRARNSFAQLIGPLLQ